jgi:anaerobic magnesium-protoporphyrin IX monomethyl ester cyclase
MVKRMSEAGARYIFVGFESGRQEFLDDYKKKTRVSEAKETVNLLRRYGIQTHASFIIGAIDETKAMVKETIRFAKALRPEAVQFSILTPYPGTRLFNEVRNRIRTYDWDLYDCLHSVIELDYLSKDDLEGLLKKAYRSFYLTPERITKGLLSGIRGKGIKLSSIINILTQPPLSRG